MPGSVLFLGAGASTSFRIPTMKEMVIEFEKHLSHLQLSEHQEYQEMKSLYADIKETLIQIRGKERVDIETILSVLIGLNQHDTISAFEPLPQYFMSKAVSSEKGLLDKLKSPLKVERSFDLLNDRTFAFY